MLKVFAFISAVAFLCVFSHYVAKAERYEQLSEQQKAQMKIYLEQNQKADRIVADLEEQLFALNEQSQQREEELKNELKNNKCANELVPAPVANELRQRANSLR